MAHRQHSIALGIAAAVAAVPACADRAPAPAPAPAAAPTVPVSIDGSRIASLAMADIDDGALHALLPAGAPSPDRWQHLRIEGAGGHFIDIPALAESYPGARVTLTAERGALRAAVAPRVAPGLPAEVARLAARPIATVSEVRSIDIRTTDAIETPPAATTSLTLVIDGRRVELADADLAGLPVVRGEKAAETGWSLADLARGQTHGAIAQLTVVGAGNSRYQVDPAALADPRHTLLLRRNRRGDLRFKHLRAGAPRPTLLGEARGVERIEIARR